MTHDPGGSKRFPLQPGVIGNAEFGGENREYRHWLLRDWDGGPEFLSIGLNPSTAEADVDDPTIRLDIALARRLDIALARRLGFGRMVKLNVCDYRATSPKVCAAYHKPCSDVNLQHIARIASVAGRVVLCCGAPPVRMRDYFRRTLQVLEGHELWCLGTTKDGYPEHPFFKGNRELVRYR